MRRRGFSVPYLKGLAVAGIVLAAGALFVGLTHRSLKNTFREAFQKQQQAGTLPPEFQGVDFDSLDRFPDFSMKLPHSAETQLQIAILLADFWYLWVTLTVAACLGAAALRARRRGLS